MTQSWSERSGSAVSLRLGTAEHRVVFTPGVQGHCLRHGSTLLVLVTEQHYRAALACGHSGNSEYKHRVPERLEVVLKSCIPVCTACYFTLQKGTYLNGESMIVLTTISHICSDVLP